MPYKSQAQAAYFNANRAKLEGEGVNLDEWNAASKGTHLPKRAPAAAHKPHRPPTGTKGHSVLGELMAKR